MQLLFRYIGACGLVIMLVTQASAQRKLITGRVLDSVQTKPLVDVLVINKKTNETTLTNDDGYYFIKMAKTDTVVFYLLGQFPRYLFFKDDADYRKQAHLIIMKPNIEELKEVEVVGQKRERAYKYPFNTVPASIGSPISFLYEQFSGKYEQYRKVQQLMEKKEKEDYIQRLRSERFTRELVLQVTGISKSEVDEFMKKSTFSKEFLEQASDYELIVEIIRKYKFWKKRK